MNLKNMSGFLHLSTDSLHVGSHLAKVFFDIMMICSGDISIIYCSDLTRWLVTDLASKCQRETWLEQASSLLKLISYSFPNLILILEMPKFGWKITSYLYNMEWSIMFWFEFQIIWWVFWVKAMQYDTTRFVLDFGTTNLHGIFTSSWELAFLHGSLSTAAEWRMWLGISTLIPPRTNRPFIPQKKSTMIWTLIEQYREHWVHNTM